MHYGISQQPSPLTHTHTLEHLTIQTHSLTLYSTPKIPLTPTQPPNPTALHHNSTIHSTAHQPTVPHHSNPRPKPDRKSSTAPHPSAVTHTARSPSPLEVSSYSH
ncbi:hypothetical protein DL98DRAFT_519223 [Cadophora sp. DSE1049]|nr:hypothetical protein DL98DRAFT_519223 [Cadophora sp. DSE1049]